MTSSCSLAIALLTKSIVSIFPSVGSLTDVLGNTPSIIATGESKLKRLE